MNYEMLRHLSTQRDTYTERTQNTLKTLTDIAATYKILPTAHRIELDVAQMVEEALTQDEKVELASLLTPATLQEIGDLIQQRLVILNQARQPEYLIDSAVNSLNDNSQERTNE